MSSTSKKYFLILLAVGISLLLCFNPEQHAWFPRCLLFQLTGLECPLCGTQRALHQLLQGNVEAALRYNALLLLTAPYAIAILWTILSSYERAKRVQRKLLSRKVVLSFLFIYVVWGVLRNVFL